MFEAQLGLINSALEGIFDRVLNIFEEINMQEHRNELICFTGVDGYKLGEAEAGGEGSVRRAEVVFVIKALGKRGMSAAELCEIFDEKTAPAARAAIPTAKELKRLPCVFLKDSGRYCVSAEIAAEISESAAEIPENIGFSVGGEFYPCMKSFEIKREVKTGETPTIGSGIRTRVVGTRPLRIKAFGKTAGGAGPAVYTKLSLNLGAAAQTVTVGGLSFGLMVMTGLELSAESDGSGKIEAEFTEVNES